MDEEAVVLALFVAAPIAFGFAARAFVRRSRAAPGGPTRLRLVAGNALVGLFLLSVACLVGECGLRWFRDSTDSFGILVSTQRWFDKHYVGNAIHWRDDQDPGLGEGDGRRRVTFLGDSFTAGHGVANVDDRFANLVRKARPQWHVDVYGRNGIDTGDELKYLADGLPTATDRPYPTDVVVLVYCLNDVTDLDVPTNDMLHRVYDYRTRGYLARGSRLFDLVRLFWILGSEPELRGYYPNLAAQYEGERWNEQRARLRRLRDVIASRGGRLAVVTFPFLNRLGDEYPMRDVHRRLGEFWKEEGVPHLDLLPIFEHESPHAVTVGFLDAHPNEKAHLMAADAILPFLDRVIGTR